MRLALALLLVLFAPSASAQDDTLVVDLADVDAPLAPGEAHALAVVVQIECAALDAPARVALAASGFGASVRVEPQAFDAHPDDCEEGRWTRQALATATLPANAEAYSAGHVRVVATLGSREAAGESPFEVAFAPDLVVSAPQREAATKPQGVVVFPVKIENRGNGALRVEFRVLGASAGMSVPAPAALIVAAPGGNGPTTVEVPVSAISPYKTGRVSETGGFDLALSWRHPLRDELVGNETLTFRVATEGFYAPAGAVPLAALAACVAAAWRRKDNERS